MEVVALSALTTFLLGVGNGAAGEIGKAMTLSTGALVRRALGRETPLPAGAEDRQALAGRVYARVSRDPREAGEWALLMEGGPDQDAAFGRWWYASCSVGVHQPAEGVEAVDAGSDPSLGRAASRLVAFRSPRERYDLGGPPARSRMP